MRNELWKSKLESFYNAQRRSQAAFLGACSLVASGFRTKTADALFAGRTAMEAVGRKFTSRIGAAEFSGQTVLEAVGRKFAKRFGAAQFAGETAVSAVGTLELYSPDKMQDVLLWQDVDDASTLTADGSSNLVSLTNKLGVTVLYIPAVENHGSTGVASPLPPEVVTFNGRKMLRLDKFRFGQLSAQLTSFAFGGSYSGPKSSGFVFSLPRRDPGEDWIQHSVFGANGQTGCTGRLDLSLLGNSILQPPSVENLIGPTHDALADVTCVGSFATDGSTVSRNISYYIKRSGSIPGFYAKHQNCPGTFGILLYSYNGSQNLEGTDLLAKVDISKNYSLNIGEWFIGIGSNLVPEDASRVHSYLEHKWLDIPPFVLCVGNSLTRGSTSNNSVTQSTAWPARLMDKLTNADVLNTGINSRTHALLSAEWTTSIIRYLYRPKKKNIVVIWEISNSIQVPLYYGQYVPTVEQVHADYVALCNKFRNEGWLVVAVDCIPRGDFTAQMNTLRSGVNALVESQWSTYADAFVKLTANSAFSSNTSWLNTTYYDADTIHLTAAANDMISDLMKPAVEALLA